MAKIPIRSLKVAGGAKLPVRSMKPPPEPLEQSINAELLGVENELTRRMAELTQQFRDEIDGDYYCVVVFQTRRQLFAWAAAKGLIKEGDELRDLFVDGERLAQRDGVKLPPGPAWQATKTKSRYSALARPLPTRR